MLNQSTHFAYGRWGGGLLTLLTIFILLSTFKLQWVSMPLSDGWTGMDLVMSHFEVPLYWFAAICYIVGTLIVFFYPRIGGAILLMPAILAMAWPILVSVEPAGIIPSYLEEARARAVIEQVLNFEQNRNVNIQPAYQAYFDIATVWEQLSFMFTSLSFGWYLFCVLGYLFPLLAVASFAKKNSMSVIHLCGLFVVFVVLFIRVGDDALILPKNTASPYGFSETLAQCENNIKKNTELMYSDYFIARCAEAYNYFHSRSDGVAGLPFINTHMGGRRFLRLNESQIETIEQKLLTLRQLNERNALTTAFKQYGLRHYKNLQHIKSRNAIEAEQYNLAKLYVSKIPDRERDPASWVLYGYASAKLGQPAVAENAFNQALIELDHEAIAASLFCSFGDSMTLSGNAISARKLYQSCYEQDSSGNYWAVHKLGGT